MRVFAIPGKGGSAKSTACVSLGLALAARGDKTIILDNDSDGGSIWAMLRILKRPEPNTVYPVSSNLEIVAVQAPAFQNIWAFKKGRKKRATDLKGYLAQFPSHYGIGPYGDMPLEFFGMPTDTDAVLKFASLIMFVRQAKQGDYKNIILDLEPTSGLAGLIKTAEARTRSMENMRDMHPATRQVLGLAFPDIKGYLEKSEYVRNIEAYAAELVEAVEAIRKATYILTCMPEYLPVVQTHEVRVIVENFGGQVHGQIINNIRGEEHESRAIELLDPTLKTLRIRRRKELHHADDPIPILTEIGNEIAGKFC